MSDLTFDTITKNLQKKQNTIISLKEFREFLWSITSQTLSENRIYKLTHLLKNKSHLLSIKKDLLYVKKADTDVDLELIEEQFYRKLLKDHCDQYCDKNRYIWELTALELHIHSSSITIPEEISIFNWKKQSIETVMLDKKVNFKFYKTKWENLFLSFQKQTKKIRIKWLSFLYANLELAILECLYSPSIVSQNYIETLISRVIKLNQKSLNLANIQFILKTGKHNSSANRLLKLTKKQFPNFAKELETIIKKYWNLV